MSQRILWVGLIVTTLLAGNMATAQVPDDVYWDNSMSPSVAGVDGEICAAAIYNGQLVIGGSFQVAGDNIASNIANWNGSSWLPLGPGTNRLIRYG